MISMIRKAVAGCVAATAGRGVEPHLARPETDKNSCSTCGAVRPLDHGTPSRNPNDGDGWCDRMPCGNCVNGVGIKQRPYYSPDFGAPRGDACHRVVEYSPAIFHSPLSLARVKVFSALSW